MAEFIVSGAQIDLSADERRQLLARIAERVRDRASRRFAIFGPQTQVGEPAFPEPLHEGPGSTQNQVPAKLSRTTARGRANRPPNRMIVGPFNGKETAPYDDADVIQWNQGDVICAPYASQLPCAALFVRLFTGLGHQMDAWANAAIWFWAKPSTDGLLQFSTFDWTQVRYINGLTALGARAAGQTYVQSGIVEVTLNPFSTSPMADLEEMDFVGGDFQIGQNDRYKQQDTITAGMSAIPMGSTVYATVPHVYACCLWITANLSTRGDAGVEIDASFVFNSIDVVVP